MVRGAREKMPGVERGGFSRKGGGRWELRSGKLKTPGAYLRNFC